MKSDGVFYLGAHVSYLIFTDFRQAGSGHESFMS